MGLLRISLFGGFHLTHDSSLHSPRVTRAAQAIFAYLLLHRQHSHPREVLAGAFWGDQRQEQARSCLNTALWRLRCALEPRGIPRGTYLVTLPTGEVSFNWESEHWLDVAVFENRVGQCLAQPLHSIQEASVPELEQALSFYTGDLLEGFYEDWALRERERLRALYLNGLARLMRYYRAQGEYEASLRCALKILYHDPLREEVQRVVMRLYLATGQRALAARQYEACRDILAEELGIEPMRETQLLYAQIKAGVELDPRAGAGDSVKLDQALQELRRAVGDLDEAREQLGRALRLVERAIESNDA